MLIETKQINIVQVYEENIFNIAQLKITDIKNKIIELWDKVPVITQFPDLIAIIEPTQQLSCIVQNKKATISNQDITNDFNGRDLENYIRFVGKFPEIIGKSLKVFGFNYSFFINFPNEKLVDIRNKNILLINNPTQEELLGGGINFSYIFNGDRLQIVSTPIYGDDLKNMIGLGVQTNVHFFKNEIPPFADFLKLFKSYHEELKKQVDNIFGIN